jgi:predicted metalloprotease with PDZ domain
MRSRIGFFALIIVLLFAGLSIISAQNKFYINLNDRSDDTFKITLIPQQLNQQNKVYNFASTAPGTYQRMDIGRYVKSFKAFDKNGEELSSKQISINRWEISSPEKIGKIEYSVSDTWDTPMKENFIYQMCGTSLEDDHAMINGQCVFGFFDGMQNVPLDIKIDYPDEWLLGTALKFTDNKTLTAKNYDHAVDSPIMIGRLTKSSMKIDNTDIHIYTYSKSGQVTSDNMMYLLEDIMNAASQFTDGLPVNDYTFLFHFENFSAGAWEHNYSSSYVFKDQPLEEYMSKELRSIAAHEFYHVVTPLNIHSELVSNFDFTKPVMSQHLWLYEGVTEWAADILQLRDYLMTIDDYLSEMRAKLATNDFYDQKISLVELSKASTEMQEQYGNIYMKGALVASLLDLRIIDLSGGKFGLREVVNKLYKDYGADKSFSEELFFDEFVKRTFPEIKDFIDRYIKGTEKLPIKEYFAKIGVDYSEFSGFDSTKVSIGLNITLANDNLVVNHVENPESEEIKAGDILKSLNGEELNLNNASEKTALIRALKVGEFITLGIERNGELKEVKVFAKMKKRKHSFQVLDNPGEKELFLRSVWLKNL